MLCWTLKGGGLQEQRREQWAPIPKRRGSAIFLETGSHEDRHVLALQVGLAVPEQGAQGLVDKQDDAVCPDHTYRVPGLIDVRQGVVCQVTADLASLSLLVGDLQESNGGRA